MAYSAANPLYNILLRAFFGTAPCPTPLDFIFIPISELQMSIVGRKGDRAALMETRDPLDQFEEI